MRHAAAVRAQLGVGLQGWARGDFAFEPGGEGRLLCDFAGGAQAGDEGGGVVAFGVGKVLKVESGLDGWVAAREVEAPLGAGARDVGRHAEGVDGLVVAEALGVEAEGDLVAVHHYVGGLVRVGGGAAEEETGVGVHGCLVWGHGRVEFPHYNCFGVVEEVGADAGDVVYEGDTQRLELLRGTDAGKEKQARRVDCASAEDRLLAGVEGEIFT